MAANLVTTTVTTTTSTQCGQQISVGSTANTIQVGNFVTDVSLNPYIAAQQIGFRATGLRPNIYLNAFFDSVNVTQYCAPGIVAAIGDPLTNSTDGVLLIRATATPTYNPSASSLLQTDNNGTIVGVFNLPAGTFKTGDRVFELADVNNIAQGNGAITTQATAIFTASNLNVTKQGVTLTTVNPIIGVIPVSNTVVTTNTSVTTTPIPCNIVYIEPIAQSFTIDTPDNSSGIFATSLNVYFEQKPISNTNGVTVYICQTNNGYPDGSNIIPFSTTHLPWSSINVSADATLATTFTFESPVFLTNALTYAFIIKPDGCDPDYRVYDANLGDTDITTGHQVFSQPNIGTAFYGATMTEWTALQTKYLKYDINAAQFSPRSGVAKFNNANTDYVYLLNIAYNTTSSSVLPGDVAIQSVNSSPSTACTAVFGMVKKYDVNRNILFLETTTGNFTPNTYVQIHRFANSSLLASPGPNTTTLQAYGNTGNLHSIVVDALVPNFAFITPPGTSVNFDYIGTSNTYVQDSVSNKLVFGTQTCFYDEERRVFSYSTENSNMSGAKSATLEATMYSDSTWISPLIDTVKSYQQTVQNLVSPIGNYYNELYTNGNDRTKYISVIVTLATGQDAEDLQVTLTARRPPGTDIKVYARFLNGSDPDSITNKVWTPLINQGASLYSDPSNPSAFNEYTYTVSRSQQYIHNQLTGTIVANSTLGTTINGTGTTFGTDAFVGGWIIPQGNSTFTETPRQIVTVANSSQLTINSPFGGDYTSGNNFYLVFPPSTPWTSNSGAPTQIAGTVTANTTSNIIVGSGTNFLTLTPGQIIQIGGYEQSIVSIANSTSLTVGTVWAGNYTGNNIYTVAPSGLSYFTANNILYSTFKRFQIKVNLQSNDSSKVPMISDLTALAMQL